MSLVSFLLIYRYKQSDTWLAKTLLCLIYKFSWLMYLIYYKYFIFLNFSALTKLANSSYIVWYFFCMCYSNFNLCNIQMYIWIVTGIKLQNWRSENQSGLGLQFLCTGTRVSFIFKSILNCTCNCTAHFCWGFFFL